MAWLVVVALLSQGWLSVPLGVRMSAAVGAHALAGPIDAQGIDWAGDARDMAAADDGLCSDQLPAPPTPDSHHDNCPICQSALQPLLLAAIAPAFVLDHAVAPPEIPRAAEPSERVTALGYRSRAPPLHG